MRVIALEEHFATPGLMEGPGAWLASYPQWVDPLLDIGDGRVAAMDAAGIDTAVLSLTAPGVEQLEGPEAVKLARESNNILGRAVREHSGRLAGFAAVPISVPDAAADELERAVREHGFLGAVINGHSSGRYLDDPFFRPVLDRVTALGIPVYLHPTLPPPAVVEACYAGVPDHVSFALSTVGWGWHANTATHVLRLILGGVFDRYPGLQIIIGHMGETLPFMLPRFDTVLPPQLTHLRRPVSAYLRENVSYTFANFNDQATFANLLAQVGIDRIMFSADYPFGSMAEGREFLDALPISAREREQIAYQNAEKLLVRS
jgi:predicted TIM-barrel fold metal-dependent hydrolase